MTRNAVTCACTCALLFSLAACAQPADGYEHASEHPAGHNHHEANHGHRGPSLRATLYSDRFEVFVEYAPAVVGQALELLVHVTLLDGWKPMTEGSVRVALDGPVALQASASAPLRPGIYRLTVTPPQPGAYRGRIELTGDVAGSVDGLQLDAYATAEAAAKAAPAEDEGAPIEFLKEQQWSVAFGTEVVTTSDVAASIEVAGTVETPPGGSAEVSAPVAGSIVTPAQGLPRPGDSVRKGQLLALLSPAPSSPEDAARAQLAVAESAARKSAAQATLSRSERLIADQAISQRELDDARRELQLAGEAVSAAQQAADLFAGVEGKAKGGSWRLVAPIAGALVSVDAMPGAAAAPGQVLFRIVDMRELWIRARVPEQDAARMRAQHSARYRLAGSDAWRALGAAVSLGRTVDPVARTVDVIYAVRDVDPALRVGGLAQISIPVGETFTGIVIPRSAVIDQDGRDAVYVQLDGEHFAQRAVRVGARAGDAIGIVHGLSAGTRIVTRGAQFVRLADRPQGEQPHGHIH